MTGPTEHPPSSPKPSSSFPISSPTFWVEAAGASLPDDRPASPSAGVRKRTRFASPSPPSSPSRHPSAPLEDEDIKPGSPLREVEEDDKPTTTLSYLPNRLSVDISDPHAYLAADEYRPNAFGDIGDYMRKKEIKVQTQNRDIALAAAASGLPQIFKDISFYINGNTHPPMEELRKLILQRGGEVRPVLRSKGMVKFIIAPMLTQMKFKQFANYRVVREGWILESVKEGKLLDWSRWKLTPQGGWEESGRKGMEGFLAGRPTEATQAIQAKASTPASGLDEVEEVPPLVETPAAEETEDEKPASVLDRPQTPPRVRAAATQSLLAPVRASTPRIPISPGAIPAPTPQQEKTPAKVHKPEGVWEYYHSKESNDDAARLLQNQEWRLRNTAERGNEGGFIDGYYQNSRLHHLSTWKAELRVLVAAAQRQSEEQSLSHPDPGGAGALSLSTAALPRAVPGAGVSGAEGSRKVIFHVDFDCFFVSCGLATRPHLKGKPAVVCHSQAGRMAGSTSEIASASYEARAKGVRNGMSLGRARTLVGEDLQTIPYEFETYKKFSLAFYTVLMGYADELQAVSVDEALIDVTSAVLSRESAPPEAVDHPQEMDVDGSPSARTLVRDVAVEIAQKIRDDVRKETSCEVSIGISHNVLLAKLATRRAKPAGVYHVVPPEIPDFLAGLDVEDLPSVGHSMKQKIEEKFHTTTCGELLSVGKKQFQDALGPTNGKMVWGYIRGMDDRKLEAHKERKSISAEMNYGIRFRNQEQAEICVTDLAAEVAKRMRQVSAKGKLLTLKLLKRHPDAPIEPPKFLGHGWCETFNKSTSIGGRGGVSMDEPGILGSAAVKLLRELALDPAELRGVGIQITKLDGEKASPRARAPGQGVLSFAKKRTRMGEIKAETPGPILDSPAAEPPKDEPQADSSKADTDEADGREDHVPVEIVEDDAGDRSPTHSLPRDDFSPSPPPPPPDALPPIVRNASAGPSRPPLGITTSSDGIDPDFLAALPEELRREVKQDFARTRAASAASAAAAPVPLARLPSPPLRQSTTPARHGPPADQEETTPTKAKGKHHAAHITRQLRPKVKTQLKAAAVAELPLYSAWARADAAEDEIVDLTGTSDDPEIRIGDYGVAELRDLGIDPVVFGELPPEVQKDVVEAERSNRQKRKILHRPADTSRLRARERLEVRTGSRSPSRAGADSPLPVISGPRITVTRAVKPTLLKATSVEDVKDTVERWITSRKAGPAIKDSRKVKEYLLKCMAPAAGMGGVEIALEVLRWMRVVIADRWGGPRPPDLIADRHTGNDGEWAPLEEGEEGSKATSEWWDTWLEFVREIDDISRERFGAGIRL